MNVKDLFNSLNLPQWEISNFKKLEGGQAEVLTITHSDGRQGVFRALKKTDAKSVERFKRELKILTNTQFSHPNIIEIFDWSKDDNTCWYISKLGHDFTEYWKQKCLKMDGSSKQKLHEAHSIIIDLAAGLIKLHEADVIHRDIKPENIVIINNKPVLIDFGLAYLKDEPRLSPDNEAVGNRGFSHDKMRYRLDNPTPWLDIFNLAQIFMWMVAEKPDKSWPRPVDWRYVNYPADFSGNMLNEMNAIMSICTEEHLSPKNAKEFIDFVNSIILTKSIHPPEMTQYEEEIRKIREEAEAKVKQGIASRALAKAQMDRVFTDSVPLFYTAYSTIERLMDNARKYLSDLPGMHIEKNQYIAETRGMEQWIETIRQGNLLGNDKEDELYELLIGPVPSGTKFALSIYCKYWGTRVFNKELNDNFLPFTLTIISRGTHQFNIDITYDNNLYIDGNPTEENKIYEMILNLAKDPRAWAQLS